MAAVLNAERLEVSVDGLTLSPDPEERPGAEGAPLLPPPLPPPSPPGAGRGPGAAGEQPAPGEAAAGGAAEEARRLEQRWGFGLEELYGLALRFFKEKDGKAFHPTYEEKLKLVALHKQVLMGPYNPDTCPEVGFFDVLGNDRRREWAALGNMSKEDAMVEFVKLLNRCCHLFSTYVASHKIEKEEQEKKRKEEEERRRREEEERERLQKEEEKRRREEEERLRREEEERRRIEEERLRLEQQKQQIMAALNSQTAVQFQQYAAQQYPGNFEQQQLLIRQLQEQHYQQYMQQLYQVQLAQQQAALQKQQEVAVAGASLPTSSKMNAVAPGDRMSVNGQAKTHTDSSEKELEPEAAEEAVENGPKESLPVIAAPSMWTRPQIKDFKEKIRQDADSVITVGRGEVVTVRVPTHEEGSYLFWEFATDNYDIGFGVYFEWTDSPNTAVSVHVSESSDDDEEEEGRALENVSNEEKAKKNATKPLLDEIVPVYRRDCHEEVYAGSHQYPGRGVYLLKFDNSYSLWRSKSVYYRVYYTR
ncbi:Golgi resident protein GCP60 isoform X2 [Canis lupus baileyi]|uniref:Golgi resident protein GCP60 isoform X2 n=1 Tax=Canis lupus familiaris TaxID=9615 RepID=UPI0018F416BA|nr:Golgi resident protein GCP60 isoform X2 [Canis lupus familiaris]XP_038425264.1 Golgi resident protein GCP60 isoform X2 [Canis lupus familiaris]XP_038527590.1 Golgi resident protein GCP60 isoform X2 [Canis lupus familiaris]XP_048968420.1 Golgi resident protein GCP60 isoform X3 [Canis lupus dingo]